MPTYNITTNFTTKDNLNENNPLRVIKGSEFGLEFTNIKTAVDGLNTAQVTNTSGIATNTSNITTNASGIATNATNIATNTSNIATNTSDVATNTTNIATNATNIGTNTANITTNTNSIGTLGTTKANVASPIFTDDITVDKIKFTSNNTAAGLNTFTADTTSTHNTAYGADVLKNVTTESLNVGVGSNALRSNLSSRNSALGAYALTHNTLGHRNTSIGYFALSQNTTGNYNTGIGANAQSSSSTATGQVTLGDSNVTNLRCNDTSISSLSDVRDKTDIIDSPYGLDFINTIQPKQYKWQTREGNIKDGSTRIGFIAQELLEACQGENDKLELVMEDNPDRLEAKYGNLLPIMVQAIKDLTARIEELES